MNEQMTDKPTSTRRFTDTALVIIAIAAIAAFVWRRFRRRPSDLSADSHTVDTPEVDDKVGSVGNASV